jgi:hypothetical protein
VFHKRPQGKFYNHDGREKSMVIGDARAKLSESELFFILRCINAMPAIVSIDAFSSYFTFTVPNIPASGRA